MRRDTRQVSLLRCFARVVRPPRIGETVRMILPTSMRAAVISTPGGPEVLRNRIAPAAVAIAS